MNDINPGPVVHILKEGKTYCGMPGLPKDWPDNHLYLSYQDEANASQVSCTDCIARRQAGPHLSERLNGDSPGQVAARHVPLPSPDGKGGTSWVCDLPDGVALDASGEDAYEEKTGQSAHFDRDLGRWSKVG